MSMRRFQVAEHSMLPDLRPGDEFVASTSLEAGAGDIVAFPHPQRSDDFWLVKRVGTPPHPIPVDTVWVLSDNREATEADSRTLGPIPRRSLWPRVESLDEATFAEAVALLVSEDPVLARVVARHGIPRFWHRPPGFATLALLILEQQVSLESGAAMYLRLHHLSGEVTPESVLASGEAGLRAIGVTRQKTGYLLELAGRIVGGELDLDRLSRLPPAEARAALLEVKGIGTWTAEAYLLSALRIPDMFPIGDRALQVGAGEVLGMASPPTPVELEILSTPWRPVRAVAARIIWHSYLVRRGRAEPEPPLPTGV